MAFRLPANLDVGMQFQAVSPGDVIVMENSLPPRSRVLVGLVFAERYDGFLEDCENAEAILRDAEIPTWPDYDRLVTPDPDGEPVVWVSYQSSPAFWTTIAVLLGSVFLLPILSVLPMWIIDKLFPGTTELISMVIMMIVMGGMMMLMQKTMVPTKKETKEEK